MGAAVVAPHLLVLPRAKADPTGNPLLRMKAGLEASLAAAVGAADARTSAQLEAAAAAAKAALSECDGRLSGALAARAVAQQAADDRAALSSEKQAGQDTQVNRATEGKAASGR
jgi:hypothetical protein